MEEDGAGQGEHGGGGAEDDHGLAAEEENADEEHQEEQEEEDTFAAEPQHTDDPYCWDPAAVGRRKRQLGEELVKLLREHLPKVLDPSKHDDSEQRSDLARYLGRVLFDVLNVDPHRRGFLLDQDTEHALHCSRPF